MEHTGFQGKEYCFKGDEIFEQVKQSNYLSTSKGRSRHHSHVLILKYQHWERKKKPRFPSRTARFQDRRGFIVKQDKRVTKRK